MEMSEETNFFGIGGGCAHHGDEFMRECGMCGCEYCSRCHKSYVCPDCAADRADEEEDAEANPDFEDVKKVDDVLEDDKEADQLLASQDDLIPPEDLVDDEVKEERA